MNHILRAWQMLAGRYELIAPMATGGGGQSYVALDHETKKRVVVKELTRDLGSTGDAWRREADVLRQLRHPQIPAFLDAFVAPVRLVSRLHLVMELVEGRTLIEDMVLRRLEREEALALVEDLLSVIAYLHELTPPVIHRDLKPTNLMVRDGRIVVIDFGTATDDVQRTFGHTVAVGTMGYVAPEQFDGAPTTASDVYSIGVIALQLLTRRDPTTLRSGTTLAWAKVVRDLPGPLREWFAGALGPVAQRYANATVALGALKAARRALENGGALDRADSLDAPSPASTSLNALLVLAIVIGIPLAIFGLFCWQRGSAFGQ